MGDQDTEVSKPNPTVALPSEGHNFLTRREFLGKVTIGSVAVTEALLGLRLGVNRMVHDFLTHPEVMDEAFGVARDSIMAKEELRNPEFMPIEDILRVAVDDFRRNTGGHEVRYHLDPDFKQMSHYAKGLIAVYEGGVGLPTTGELSNQMGVLSSPLARRVYSSTDSLTFSPSDMLTEDSGLYRRFCMAYPGADTKTKNAEFYLIRDKFVLGEFAIMQRYITLLAEKTKLPVSISKVLEHSLYRNDGDLSEAIADSSMFLKFKARNYVQGNPDPQYQTNQLWMEKYIKDQFQGKNYQKLPLGPEKINLIGKPYHTTELVRLLRVYPPEIVRLGGLTRQLITYSQQGPDKVAADLETLNSLKSVRDYLFQFKSS